MSENRLVGIFFYSKYTKLLAKHFPLWENLGAKLNFRAPIISFVGNLQLYVGKTQLPVRPYFLNPRHSLA